MKHGRRKFSGGEKMAILRRNLVEKVPVPDVCDGAGSVVFRRMRVVA